MITPDQTSQLKQITEGHASLKTTLESIRVSGGADPVKIRLAESLFEKAIQYAREAIGG